MQSMDVSWRLAVLELVNAVFEQPALREFDPVAAERWADVWNEHQAAEPHADWPGTHLTVDHVTIGGGVGRTITGTTADPTRHAMRGAGKPIRSGARGGILTRTRGKLPVAGNQPRGRRPTTRWAPR